MAAKGSAQSPGASPGRDGGHRIEGADAAALQLPVLVMPQKHRTHQAGDGGVVGEDAHHPKAALENLVCRVHLSVRSGLSRAG